jgi:hypothetical protein
MRVNIRTPDIPITNSTETSRMFLGNRSAMAPANRAMKFNAMRAAAISPTRNGESVRVSTNQPSTADSIWVPMPTSVVDAQTKTKFRYRKIPRGDAAWVRVEVSFNV